MGKTPNLYYWNTVKQSLDYKLMEHHQYTSNWKWDKRLYLCISFVFDKFLYTLYLTKEKCYINIIMCSPWDHWDYRQEKFEDAKGVIRIRKLKDRQHNGQKKKDKGTNNDL